LTAASVPIACRWELIGGLMAVLGAVALNALVYFGSGRAVFSTALMISSPFFIVGGLFLVCRWRTRQAQRQQTPESVGLSRAKAELEPAVTDMVPETVKQAV
jgi:high-affinity Fe2+/Pb2+ permease